MDEKFLRILRCPFCAGRFTLSATGQDNGARSYGVLSCYCERYPVVAGIPIFKKDYISPGQRTDDVVGLIDAKQYGEALVAALTPPPPSPVEFAPAWIRALPSFRGMVRFKTLFGLSGLSQWREQTQALLTKPVGKHTFTELWELYYRQSGVVDRSVYGDYFSRRFGQARYLSVISLASVLPRSQGPVLDLGCGLGHVTHHLTRWANGELVIGLDYDFMLLYVAKNCVAPNGHYVCAGADISLPFANRSSSLTICSDAIFLFLHQASCMREIQRVTSEDGVMIVSFRNGAMKQDLYKSILPSLPPEGVEELIGAVPHRLIDNRSIMERYQEKLGPPLAVQGPLSGLDGEQWLSLVASHQTGLFRDYPAFEEWPHIEGSRLGVNPLYREESRDPYGDVRLRRQFPSEWYEQENGSEDGKYSPESVTVSSQGMLDITQGKRTLEIEKLIKQRVVLGFPETLLEGRRSE